MIKLFRKIRQKLLSENKFSKYLLYAVGEIVLVVIGILIALQINNWNEGKKEAESQQKLFANLKIDFENRLSELEEFHASKRQAITNISRINAIISSSHKEFDEDEVGALLAYQLNNFSFNEDFKLLEGVFNTGLINDIKNETLKRKLIEWPQLVEEMLEEQRIFQNDNLTKYGPLLEKYISNRRLYEHFDFRNYALPKGGQITLKENYEGLLKDPLLENLLATKEVHLRISVIDLGNLTNEAKEIIRLLELTHD
ncbi:DUF6090 family protein [Croceivirga thetidis]|uniref:Uncharacterized protein n=1 Tax=Croceivirga thetidis TaxID=2721623 RepID=A0ABX1GN07_9FLAO|nr:DUF6090 family protein [Croceivirga thetidis]NKI30949.1 hypothetical protein [Croceivirga thetidis]